MIIKCSINIDDTVEKYIKKISELETEIYDINLY